MTAPDDSFPVFPASRPPRTPDPEPATSDAEPTASVAPTMPEPSSNTPSSPASTPPEEISKAAQPVAPPSASGSDELLTQEQIETVSEEITDAIIDAAKESDVHASITEHTDARHASRAAQHEMSSSRMHAVADDDVRRTNALRARQSRRDEKLNRIIEYARNRGSVTNDDIEKILRISNATATRYANMLVVRGQLFRTGKGRGVRYTPRS